MTREAWRIHVVEFAQLANYPVAYMVQGVLNDPAIELPFAFVVARKGARVVLCDCGFLMSGRGGELARRFGVSNWVSPVEMLAQLGISTGDVTDIIISHAHYDHMGGLSAFTQARVYLQKRELMSSIELLALPERYGALSAALSPDDIVALIRAADGHQVTLLDGDQDDVVPGIHVRLSEGHTHGHQFMVIDTDSGPFIVAGDCIYSLRNVGYVNGQPRGPYQALGSAIGSVWDQFKSFDKMEVAAGGDLSRIIILHDPNRWGSLIRTADVKGCGIFEVL